MKEAFSWKRHHRDGAYLVEVCDDLVEEPETLDPLVVEVELDVELVEVGDAGEDDAHPGVGLAVEVLRRANAGTRVLEIPLG